MQMLVSLVLLSGILALALFYWINRRVLTDPRYYDPQDAIGDKKMQGKLSLRENIAYLLRSKYLLYLTLIVVAYNVGINLIEVLWKHQVRELYPNPKEFSLYINQVSLIIGIVATMAALFISSNSIRKFGWTFTAMLTPIIILMTSVGFFTLYFAKDFLEAVPFIAMQATPLAMLVFMGSAQNIFARGAKYTVFDATKEMAFVPLSPECKLKGKAAIDGICNRFGKSGGSMIHQSLLLAFSSFSATAPYVAGILLVIIGIWMVTVRLLGKEFIFLTQPEKVTAEAEPQTSQQTITA
jgi:AAA family ATP:ADP antiporter